LSKPIVVKETGAGIDPETAKKLEKVGVSAINVAGAGGTSWAAVEYYRNLKAKNRILSEVSKTFWDWGIPTAFSIYIVSKSVKIPIIGSGGIRTGLDVAKAIVLGADLAALALPILSAAIKGPKEVKAILRRIMHELRLAMFLTGSKNLEELKKVKYFITGRLKDLINSWKGDDLE
ncbi:type 2 isopentenyl-diphosphate Delta-isomerase, partial [Candidatus Geothermarchaeota archaeon]